jgi:uncharacterized damage-inducible protein DinB
MQRLVLAVVAAAALFVVARAQRSADAAPPVSAIRAADPGAAALRAQWRTVVTNIARSADELSEADYAYKPIATVRSFGELIGHVAGSQFSFCATALGDAARGEDDIEKTAKTKAALVKALKESTDYCDKAYAQTDAALSAKTTMFGSPASRMDALALNAVHDGEHYGNIVTYMRMKGMVPPSSRR